MSMGPKAHGSVEEGVSSGHLGPHLGFVEGAPKPTQDLKLAPRNHSGPSCLPGQPRPGQASTHKSVKSSRVSSGVNTSSSPITWGIECQ